VRQEELRLEDLEEALVELEGHWAQERLSRLHLVGRDSDRVLAWLALGVWWPLQGLLTVGGRRMI
jgi:hypothetical protein